MTDGGSIALGIGCLCFSADAFWMGLETARGLLAAGTGGGSYVEKHAGLRARRAVRNGGREGQDRGGSERDRGDGEGRVANLVGIPLPWTMGYAGNAVEGEGR